MAVADAKVQSMDAEMRGGRGSECRETSGRWASRSMRTAAGRGEDVDGASSDLVLERCAWSHGEGVLGGATRYCGLVVDPSRGDAQQHLGSSNSGSSGDLFLDPKHSPGRTALERDGLSASRRSKIAQTWTVATRRAAWTLD